MPVTLKQVKDGPEPESASRVRAYLAKHVKEDAPYFANEELLSLLKLSDSTVRVMRRKYMSGWSKQVGRVLWWSTPEHIKKL